MKNTIKAFAIYCPELPDRKCVAEKHFKERGLAVSWVRGIHGEAFGLLPSRPYNVNRPGVGELTPISQVGLCLSHYLLWTVCEQVDGDLFMLMEDDAKLPVDWQERFDLAMEDVPSDFDVLLVGNSNTSDKTKHHVCGDIYEVFYPFTTHCYVVHRKALPTLLTYCRDATTKIDVSMIQNAYPRLNVYTMLPRLVEQRGTELSI